eukprot:4542161-Alexandrium_andersonii.AAC.1
MVDPGAGLHVCRPDFADYEHTYETDQQLGDVHVQDNDINVHGERRVRPNVQGNSQSQSCEIPFVVADVAQEIFS